MIIRTVDGENDWNFGKGIASYASAEQAINENVKHRLLSWVGDCFFALNDGVDWKSRLDIGQQSALEQELRSVIMNSEGVMAVNSVAVVFTGSSRLFTITFNIDTIYSQNFEDTLSQAIGS